MRSLSLVVCLSASLAFAASTWAEPLPGKDFKRLSKAAGKAAGDGAWKEAAGHLRGMAEDDSKKAVDAILKLVKRHPHPILDRAAREALAGMSGDAAVQRLAKKLSSGSGAEGLLLVDVAARRSDAATAEALVGALGSRSKVIQRAAVVAAGQRKLEEAVPPLLDLLEEAEGSDPGGLLEHLTGKALAAITGAEQANAAGWRAYWADPERASRPKTGGAPPPAAGATRTRPTFFGTEVVSNRVVFVIDVSKSMEERDPDAPTDARGRRPTTGGPADRPAPPVSPSRVRIDRAKFQLAQCIRALPDRAKFTIIAYSGYLEDARALGDAFRFPAEVKNPRKLPAVIGGVPWLGVWKPKLAAASESNKESALAFTEALSPAGSTFTLRALRLALEVPGADTVILLSDGAPTEIQGLKADALLTTREILDEVAAANRARRIRIDTFAVGVGDGASFADFMRRLADEAGGSYTKVR
jgi:hypothetical protein